MKTTTRTLMTCVLVIVMAGPAYPQKKEILQLQSDMIGLKQQMNQLQSSMDEKNKIIQALVEKVFDQVNSVSTSVQKINEVVQGVNTHNDKTAGEIRVLVTNLNGRVSEVSEALEAVRLQLSSVSHQITTIKTTAEPLAGPEDVMRNAALDSVAGNYDLAIGGYKEFLEKFPANPRAAEAQLSIGDALYNQKKYEQAVIEYDLFLQKYPENDRTKSALYKKGLAHAELNQVPDALTALNKVTKDYPGTVEATGAQQKVKDLSALRRRPD